MDIELILDVLIVFPIKNIETGSENIQFDSEEFVLACSIKLPKWVMLAKHVMPSVANIAAYASILLGFPITSLVESTVMDKLNFHLFSFNTLAYLATTLIQFVLYWTRVV